MSNKPILLVSGGLDSYITWHYLNKPTIIFVNYGQPYFDIEKAAVYKLYDNIQEININGLGSLKEIYVPARNLMLASLALRHSNIIALGGVKDEKCRDKSPKAFKIMSTVLSMFNKKEVTVFSPIWHLTKSQAVKWYIEQDLDVSILHSTVSCYSTGLNQEPCNDCESCFRRFVSLAVNGVINENRLPTERIIKSYIKRLRLQPYNRDKEIIQALKSINEPIHIDNKTVNYKGVTGTLKS